MRKLKILVTVLGVLVLAGVGGVVYGIIAQRKPADPGALAGADRASFAGRAPVADWGRVTLDEPPGTQIQAIAPAGHLLILHLYTRTQGTDERLLVVDPRTGAIAGRFMVTQSR